ncbi:hypothetical protein [Kordia sp.]|uniref:hypothetical protein n=1 Tax=Kordia sp. TaxID=1965332 RepID=UPI003D292DE3
MLFVVGYNYNYTLELSAFDHEKITKNNSDNFVEKGNLIGERLELIETMLSSNFTALKQEYHYEGLAITGIGSQQIFINLDKITKYVHILDELPIEYFKTPVEKKLFEFNEHFKTFIELKYKNSITE